MTDEQKQEIDRPDVIGDIEFHACPRCGEPHTLDARRMETPIGSSWYWAECPAGGGPIIMDRIDPDLELAVFVVDDQIEHHYVARHVGEALELHLSTLYSELEVVAQEYHGDRIILARLPGDWIIEFMDDHIEDSPIYAWECVEALGGPGPVTRQIVEDWRNDDGGE